MSKELNNITDNIMNQIHDNKIKMRSKSYFIVGSILTFVGLASSVVVSVFLFGLIRFSLRSQGKMASYRLGEILERFPWWAPVFAMVGLVVGIWLLRRYDFSFKINFKFVVIGFILAVVAGGWIVDIIGLNDVLIKRGPMQGFMRQHIQNDNRLPNF